MKTPPAPDFRSPSFLRQHIVWIMDFYANRATDPSGGMYHYFLDDGTVFDARTRHLVSATRFVISHAMLYKLTGEARYQAGVRHAVDFLRQAFRDPQSGGYAWMIDWHQGRATVLDSTRHCYGMAFVMLAYAHALKSGIEEARGWLAETFDLAEAHFWEPAAGLYADEAAADWTLSPYRGQNANMHSCEAMISAYAASGEARYIERAETLARNITCRQAALANGLVWEHYHQDWSVDWDYNLNDRSNIFRPWGYQPGHHTEWAKLLLQLDSHAPADWHLPRAVELFKAGVDHSWDAEHGGLHYGFAPDYSVCDGDKYHWVQAESFAAAALLAIRTGEPGYWAWYEKIWAYCWEHFVDHQQGAWFRILDPANLNHTREKSPAGKVDYHNIGASFDVLRALGEISGE
jgi:mannose/cellobiose epimerase-like protein (N-acyl-D-glucosamine 2-epimerase family)